MHVGIIVTCFDREEYWTYLRRIIASYSVIRPVVAYCYSGGRLDHECDVRLANSSHSLGDYRLTLAGYKLLSQSLSESRLFRFIKLSVDSWPCDETILADVLDRMDSCGACYGGNYWHRNAPGSLSTDIFFADTRFGNVFEALAARGHKQDFEISMARAVEAAGRAYLIPERHPVHSENRWRCDKLKWTMSHDLGTNIRYARDYLQF